MFKLLASLLILSFCSSLLDGNETNTTFQDSMQDLAQNPIQNTTCKHHLNEQQSFSSFQSSLPSSLPSSPIEDFFKGLYSLLKTLFLAYEKQICITSIIIGVLSILYFPYILIFIMLLIGACLGY